MKALGVIGRAEYGSSTPAVHKMKAGFVIRGLADRDGCCRSGLWGWVGGEGYRLPRASASQVSRGARLREGRIRTPCSAGTRWCSIGHRCGNCKPHFFSGYFSSVPLGWCPADVLEACAPDARHICSPPAQSPLHSKSSGHAVRPLSFPASPLPFELSLNTTARKKVREP